MARKSVSTSRAIKRAKRPSLDASTQLRLPQSRRIVTARKLRARATDRHPGRTRREVPEIRLSGAWLERIGFAKGRGYLISADREFETIYLQADPLKSLRRR